MTFGERVKYRREMLVDFSQEKLAKMVGYEGRAAINKVEKGIVKVPQDKVEEYARALKTSPAYLMGWVDDPELTHEQTLKLWQQGKLKPQLLAADTASLDGKPIIIASDTIDKTQHHRNALAEKIRNSDYTDEQLDKIEKMIELMIK